MIHQARAKPMQFVQFSCAAMAVLLGASLLASRPMAVQAGVGAGEPERDESPTTDRVAPPAPWPISDSVRAGDPLLEALTPQFFGVEFNQKEVLWTLEKMLPDGSMRVALVSAFDGSTLGTASLQDWWFFPAFTEAADVDGATAVIEHFTFAGVVSSEFDRNGALLSGYYSYADLRRLPIAGKNFELAIITPTAMPLEPIEAIEDVLFNAQVIGLAFGAVHGDGVVIAGSRAEDELFEAGANRSGGATTPPPGPGSPPAGAAPAGQVAQNNAAAATCLNIYNLCLQQAALIYTGELADCDVVSAGTALAACLASTACTLAWKVCCGISLGGALYINHRCVDAAQSRYAAAQLGCRSQYLTCMLNAGLIHRMQAVWPPLPGLQIPGAPGAPATPSAPAAP